jgi:uncharacterized damage-inducible protein DinB
VQLLELGAKLLELVLGELLEVDEAVPRALEGADQLVQHAANHSTYHRGQVVTLLRILGAKATSSDMVLWDRERGTPPGPSR